MSYRCAEALQAAVYQRLLQDEEVRHWIGDAVYDAMPVTAPSGVYVALGAEEVRDASDQSGRGAVHLFEVSVLSGTDAARAGFGDVKPAAAAVVAALEDQPLTVEGARLVGLWCIKARARRAEKGAGRRVDLSFRARLDFE